MVYQKKRKDKMADVIGARPRSDKMTSQNASSRFWLLSLMVIASVVQNVHGGSRHNDSTENMHMINTTRQWQQSSVSAVNTKDELASNSDGSSNSDSRSRITPEPDDEVYDSYNVPEESPPLEEDLLNLERNRESGYVVSNPDRLPFQGPSDLDFFNHNKEYLNFEAEKQRNASSMNNNNPLEEGILDAEIDRDGTLSDMFQPKSSNQEQKRDTNNHEDLPRFEFLIGLPIENFTGQTTGNSAGVENQTRKPFIPPKSAWPVPQAQFLTAEPKLNHTTGLPDAEGEVQIVKNDGKSEVEDYVELVEIVKIAGDNTNKSAVTYYPSINGSGFYIENDAPDTSFTDLQTLFLACFATLVPLLIVLFLACGIRVMWRRYRRDQRGSGYQGGLRGGSADPLPDKRPHSPSRELKSAESGFSGGNDGNDDGTSELQGQPMTPAPANGSIITMTLKNNHLIVETEVRNDIAHGARETKMKYSPNNDGVFVVEVQRSNNQFRRSPEQRAQVHRSPLPAHASVDTDEEADYLNSIQDGNSSGKKKALGNSNTGLSTSDLSISSSSSHNPSYAYGNQIGYEQGHYGYPVYTGYVLPPKTYIPYESSREPLVTKTPTDPDKPVITAAIFKQDSIIAGDEITKTPEYNIEGSTDGPLLSDIQAREVSLHKLQDKIENGTKMRIIANSDSVHSSDTDEERYQEQQRQLGNGIVRKEQTVVEINHDKSNQCLHRADSLPPRLIEEEEKNSKQGGANSNNEDGFDTIEEESSMDCYPGDIASGSPLLGGSNAAASGARSKRASLPIITPDLYTTLKQTTKNILPNLSPKFEKFNNENSPMEGIAEKQNLPPPLITVTEEVESVVNSPEDSVPS